MCGTIPRIRRVCFHISGSIPRELIEPLFDARHFFLAHVPFAFRARFRPIQGKIANQDGQREIVPRRLNGHTQNIGGVR